MTTNDVITAITAGKLDDGLVPIMEAARLRQRAAVPQFSPGDKARLTGIARPQYIAGLTVKVLSVHRTKAYVRFDRPALARRYGPECNVPLTLLEKHQDGAR